MSYAQRITVAVTTAADGSATVYSPAIDYGQLSQIRYVKDGSNGFDNGSSFAITAEATGETLWSESAVNASATRAPRQAVHTTAGAAALFSTGNAQLAPIAIVQDRIKIVIASGGNAKSGTFVFVLV